MSFYEPAYNKISIGLVFANANEMTIMSYDNIKDKLTPTSSFLYSLYTSILKKTQDYLISIRTDEKNTVNLFSIVDGEALIENIQNQVMTII